MSAARSSWPSGRRSAVSTRSAAVLAAIGLVHAGAHGQNPKNGKDPANAPEPSSKAEPAVSKERKQPKQLVTIECQGRAYFDNTERIVVFEKDVVVTHPSFLIHCEELEVFLKEDASAALEEPKTAGGPEDPAAPENAATPEIPVTPEGADVLAGEGADPIDKMFAKGQERLVELLRYSPSGDVRAKCGWATYDSATGDLVLHEWPVVSRANVNVRAIEKDTVIYIRKNGDFEASGPAIFQKIAQ